MINRLKTLFLGFIIAGVLQLVAAMILMLRAGVPYQDPNVEMVIEWTSYNVAATYLAQFGLAALLLGGIGLGVSLLTGKLRKKSK